MRRPAVLALPALVATTLAVAGCGGSVEPGVADQAFSAGLTETTAAAASTTSTTGTTATTATSTAPTTVGASRTGTVSTDLTKEPKVPKPTGAAPTKLEIRDVVEGKGTAIASGDTAKVRYVGVLFSNAKSFDASWNRGKATFDFPLGQSQVIAGWDQGIVGMKPGGRRELIIPSDLAYGAAGQGSDIPPNSPLVFVVDLVSVG